MTNAPRELGRHLVGPSSDTGTRAHHPSPHHPRRAPVQFAAIRRRSIRTNVLRRQALRTFAASPRSSSSTLFARISTFRTLPVTVIGNESTTSTYRGIL
jgi:hypothetical protein